MSASLALSNLKHSRVRTALSLAGVAFAIVLMFMQLGFLGAVQETAVLIYNQLDFELVLRSPDYLHLADARLIPRQRLLEAASIAGVAEARAFQVTLGNWQTPPPQEGNWYPILLMAAEPWDRVFLSDEINAQLARLTTDDSILIDRKTSSAFGPQNGRRFGDDDIGVCTDLSGRRVCIRGHFELGTGLAANGAALLNPQGFRRIAPYDSDREVSLGLLKVQAGEDPVAVGDRLRAWFSDPLRYPDGPPVDVLTRDELLRQETERWTHGTPIGMIFFMGVFVAFLVGAAIVYMVLSNDVESNIGEYATLNAMGYSRGFLARVVLWLAVLLALGAFAPSVLAALGLYQITGQLSNVPMHMTGGRLALVLAMSLIMSSASGILAMRKLQHADPVDLF